MNQITIQGNSAQLVWGTPQGLFIESHERLLEISFLIAFVFHVGPMAILWNMERNKNLEEPITLQNVELIESNPEKAVAPAAEKPKSAFELLKMAIPIFSKPPQIESPRDVVSIPKIREPKISEPEKLIEKKSPTLSKAPEIRMDERRSDTAPQIAEIGKRAIPHELAANVSRPSLNLQERPLPNIPSQIKSRSQIPVKSSLSLGPVSYAPAGAPAKPVIQSVPIQKSKAIAPDKIEISKEKVNIIGPLSKRSVVQSHIPLYPSWARAKNVEADVSVRFYVSQEGDVRPNMDIEKTSGYPDLDRLVLDTLKKWKFTPISSAEDQWGIITFRFRLD